MTKKIIPEYENALEEADKYFCDGVDSVWKRESEGMQIDAEMWTSQILFNAAYWLARGEFGFKKKELYEQMDEAFKMATEHNEEDAADFKKKH